MSLAKNSWVIVPTPGDGDCLFYAVSRALREGHKSTISHIGLRQLVARTVLDPNNFTQAAMVSWMTMVEAGLGCEVPHAVPVYGAYLRQRKKLTRANLHELYTAMMDASLYWGDEYAIQVIERAYRCCLLIYSRTGQRIGHHVTSHVPSFYIPLLFENKHYSQMKVYGQSVLHDIVGEK